MAIDSRLPNGACGGSPVDTQLKTTTTTPLFLIQQPVVQLGKILLNPSVGSSSARRERAPRAPPQLLTDRPGLAQAQSRQLPT